MPSAKLTAPVGMSPRKSDGKPVKNKAADVRLTRKMLEANKIGPLGDSKSMDSGLLKAIAKYQKKIGFRNPDQVIDPGGRTFKSLLPKYEAAAREAAKVKMVEVTWRGKTLHLTEKDYDKMVGEVFKQVDGYVKSLLRNHKTSLEVYQDYLDTAQIKDGVLNAVAQAIIIEAGSVKMPKSKVVTRSISATGALERAMKSKDLKMLNTALPEAEAAVNAFNDEMLRFLKDFSGSAQTTGTVLNLTSATCFAVVGVLAAPVLVSGAGMSATAATVTSGASVSVLQSATTELGKHASGQKVTVWQSVQAVVIDGTFGAVTAGLATKLPLKFCDKMAKAVAPRLASVLPQASRAQVERFLAYYLAGSGQETLKAAVAGAVKLLNSWVKKGKIPTEKEFEAEVVNLLYAALLGGFFGKLGSFQKKWAYKHKTTLQGKILPQRLAHLAKGNEIPNVIKTKMYADVMNKVSDKAVKAGVDHVLAKATGKENEKQLEKMAEGALEKDKALQKLIDAELKKAMKKHKAGAK